MGLQFIGEMGVYFPDRDAVKTTAMDGDRVVDCYATRSALRAVGCPEAANVSEMMRHFQQWRTDIELAAMVKYRRALCPTIEIVVEENDFIPVLPTAGA
jgi:Protein of unknown function (DUF1488)